MHNKVLLSAILAGQIARAAPVVTVTNIVTLTTYVPQASTSSADVVSTQLHMTPSSFSSTENASSAAFASSSREVMSMLSQLFPSLTLVPESSHKPTNAPNSSYSGSVGSAFSSISMYQTTVAGTGSAMSGLPVITRSLPTTSSMSQSYTIPLSSSNASQSVGQSASSSSILRSSLPFANATAARSSFLPSVTVITTASSQVSLSSSGSTIALSSTDFPRLSTTETLTSTSSARISSTRESSTSDLTTISSSTRGSSYISSAQLLTSTPAVPSPSSTVMPPPPSSAAQPTATIAVSSASGSTDPITLPFATIYPSQINGKRDFVRHSYNDSDASSGDLRWTPLANGTVSSSKTIVAAAASTASSEHRHDPYHMPTAMRVPHATSTSTATPFRSTETESGEDRYGWSYPLPDSRAHGSKSTNSASTSSTKPKESDAGHDTCIFPLPGQKC